MARLFLILLLVWQPMALYTIDASVVIDRAIADKHCGEVISKTSCCAEPEADTRCGMTGSSCRCDLAPEQSDAPRPVLPPTSSTQLTLASLPSDVVYAIRIPRSAAVVRPGIQWLTIYSHNTFQAFIGIWRI